MKAVKRNNKGEITHTSDGKKWIKVTSKYNEIAKANDKLIKKRKLIAAAPELLEVVKEYLNDLLNRSENIPPENYERLERLIKKATL